MEKLLIAGAEGAAVAVECERGDNISARLRLIDLVLFENKNIISAASKHKCLKWKLCIIVTIILPTIVYFIYAYFQTSSVCGRTIRVTRPKSSFQLYLN